MDTWTNYEGRAYEVTRDEGTPDRVKQDLVSRGFDGYVYNAESRPTGRQKKAKYALLYRTPAGQFSFVYAF